MYENIFTRRSLTIYSFGKLGFVEEMYWKVHQHLLIVQI
jgi:hypothetical protein